MEQSPGLGRRTLWYIVGLNLIAAAVVLNIRYNVGVAAFSSVMYSISEIYHISLGTASIICYLLLLRCNVSFPAELHSCFCLKYRFPLLSDF